MTEHPVKLKLRLDWSEMDMFGHINNVSYFKYIQASRVNYWEAIGLTKWHQDTGAGPMLLATTCSFKKPLFYPGNIIVESRVDFIKNTSFGIHHRIIDVSHEIAAEADDVIVLYNFKTQEKVPFPDELRRKVERLEGRLFTN